MPIAGEQDSRGRFVKGNTLGRKGAAVTNSKYKEQLSTWGRKGYKVMVARHFGGDEQAANEWLASKGLSRQDRLMGIDRWGYFSHPDPGEHPAHVNGRNGQGGK